MDSRLQCQLLVSIPPLILTNHYFDSGSPWASGQTVQSSVPDSDLQVAGLNFMIIKWYKS